MAEISPVGPKSRAVEKITHFTTYTIRYKATDNAGNVGTAEREVIVGDGGIENGGNGEEMGEREAGEKGVKGEKRGEEEETTQNTPEGEQSSLRGTAETQSPNNTQTEQSTEETATTTAEE